MKTLFQITSLFVLFLSFSVYAKSSGGRVDLSSGIVLPSDNSAVYENGSQLVHSEKTIEALIEPTGGNLDFEATFVGSMNSLGYGFGADYIGQSFTLLGGLGYGSESFRFGLDTAYNIDSSNLNLDAGVGIGRKNGLSFAFVATDLTDGVTSLIGGVGYRKSGMFRFEADLEYFISSNYLFLDPAVGFELMGGKVSILGGYRILISPSGSGSFRFGFNWWVDQKFSIEYLYRFRLGEHAFGVKIAL